MTSHVREPALRPPRRAPAGPASVLTTPVHRVMIRAGRGHAVLHQYHRAGH
jgi:hypothetical protein